MRKTEKLLPGELEMGAQLANEVVHGDSAQVAGVVGVVPIISHTKDLPLRHHICIPIRLHGFCDIVGIELLSVPVDVSIFHFQDIPRQTNDPLNENRVFFYL